MLLFLRVNGVGINVSWLPCMLEGAGGYSLYIYVKCLCSKIPLKNNIPHVIFSLSLGAFRYCSFPQNRQEIYCTDSIQTKAKNNAQKCIVLTAFCSINIVHKQTVISPTTACKAISWRLVEHNPLQTVCAYPFCKSNRTSATTLSIITFSITTLSIITFSIMTLSIMTLSKILNKT